MKKFVITLASIFAIIGIFAFKQPAPKPKLFPELEKYYAGLQASQPNQEHAPALRDLTFYIRQATTSDKKINLVFACSDNSFKSIAAQAVLQSLLSVNKVTKLAVSSCGYQPAEVNPELIKIFTKHGFQVTEQTATTNGKKSFEIKFGTDMPSLIVYAKGKEDASYPKINFFLMKMCGENETNCIDWEGASYKNNLPFASLGMNVSEDEADKEFTAIATEIALAFNRSQQ